MVMERAGNDCAKGLYDALMKKFRIKHTALLQMELARFNGMKMAPNETGSDYVNRILEAKVKLVQYGYKDLQDDIHLLERLKTGLKSSVKYVQLATTLQCMPSVTWNLAVEQITVHDRLRLEEDESAKTEEGQYADHQTKASSPRTHGTTLSSLQETWTYCSTVSQQPEQHAERCRSESQKI